MLQKTTSVTLLTAAHRLQGEINTGGQRLQEVLNSSLTDFVQLENVRLYTLTNQTELLREEKRATMQKSLLRVTVLGEEKHEAPIKRQHYRVQKSHYEVFCLVGAIEVTGLMHLPFYTQDTTAILAREVKAFFPLTEASVTYDVNTRSNLNAPVALVNKAAMSFFRILGS